MPVLKLMCVAILCKIMLRILLEILDSCFIALHRPKHIEKGKSGELEKSWSSITLNFKVG